MQSGSLVGYIYDRWGIAAVEATWREGTLGLVRHTAVSLEAILDGWHELLLSTEYAGPAPDWHDVIMNGCPQ